MDKDTVTAVSTGIALIIGAFITPFFNFLKELVTGKKEDEPEYVTKCELEVKHREIIEEVGRKFASNDTVVAMQSEFKEIKGKLDKIEEGQNQQNLLIGKLLAYFEGVKETVTRR